MSKTRTVGRIVLSLGAIVAMGAPQAAFAAGTTSTTPAPAPPAIAPVHPGPAGYYQLELAPGQSAEESIRVINTGAVPATYEIYSTNATTSDVTGVSYGAATDHTGTAAWVSLPSNTVKVPPDKAKTVHFTVTVPQGTGVGQWVGGIAAQAGPGSSRVVNGSVGHEQVGAGITVVTRSLVAIVVDVRGPAKVALRVGRAALVTQNDAEQVINIPLNGLADELLFKPSMKADLTTCSGGAVLDFARQLDTFVPRTAIQYPWYLKNVLPAGCYELKTTVSDGTKLLDTYTSQFNIEHAQTVLPRHNETIPTRTVYKTQGSNETLLVLGGGLLVVVMLLIVYLIVRERSRKAAPGPGQRD